MYVIIIIYIVFNETELDAQNSTFLVQMSLERSNKPSESSFGYY